MTGNVFEWVNDWYLINYYSLSPTNDPSGPASGTYFIARGGSWFPNPVRIAFRAVMTSEQNMTIGFRCAGD